MKAITAALLAIPVALHAATLNPGDEVSLDAISKADFVTGEAPDSWKEGEVYILECWATWCGPCIAAIPHVDELYDKYHEKGLNIIGMNVWEDGRDKVAAFVEKKGDGMSYPVAYVGKGGAFETEWLKPAGVTGIPRALVVKDGKLLFGIHPATLKESTIEALLEGGEAQDKAVNRVVNGEKNRQKINDHVRAFMQASRAEDVETMEKELAAIEAIDAENRVIGRLRTDVAIGRQDWDTVAAMLKENDNPLDRSYSALMVYQKLDQLGDEAPEKTYATVAEVLADAPDDQPIFDVVRALSYHRIGRGEDALAAAREAAEQPGEHYPKAPFEVFAKSIEDGTPMTMREVMMAAQKAMEAERAKEKDQ